jgi:hypothetical protein
MKALQINEEAEMKKAGFFKPAFLFNLVPGEDSTLDVTQ